MRKSTLLLTTLLTIITIFYSSCDDSNTKKETIDLSEAIWSHTDRHLELTDTDLASKMNYYLKKDTDTVRIEQTFNKTTKESKIIGYSPINGNEKRNRTYRYSTIGDSLYLINPFLLTDTLFRGTFKATKQGSKARLEIRYKATKIELREILLEINGDPSILTSHPDDVSGTYYIIAKE